MLWLKIWSVRGASNHSAFMANGWLLLALPTKRMSYLSRKWGCGVRIKRNSRQGEPKITNINGRKLLCRPSSSYKKLLDRVTFWIVYNAWRGWYKTVAYNDTSVGVGRQNGLFLCMCSRNCIIIVIINIIVYMAVVVVCQNRQVNGPINVNMRFHTLSIILSFLSCFATQNYIQIQM